MNSSTNILTVVTIVGMTCVTIIARSFFFLSQEPWKLPNWVQHGMQYAPIAALSAVILPEVIMTQGHVISGLQDARLFAVAASLLWFYYSRSVLGTLVSGMCVYLPMHIAMGW